MTDHRTIIAEPYRPHGRLELGGLGGVARRYLPAVALLLTALLVGFGSWFLFTAKRIEIRVLEFDGSALASAQDVQVRGGFSLVIGQVRLLRKGEYRLDIRAQGYESVSGGLTIDAQSAEFEFRLQRLPGLLSISSNPRGATILIDGTEIGSTPISDAKVSAGVRELEARLPLYSPIDRELEIQGLGQMQELHLDLEANFARLTLTSSPDGAEILVDRMKRGVTPLAIDLEAGTRALTFRKEGYASQVLELEVLAGQTDDPPMVTLAKASARIQVVSEPAGAVVLLNDQYQGLSPIGLSVQPERTHNIRLRKTGYEETTRELRLSPGASRNLRLVLEQSIGEVIVHVWPEDTTLVVDGQEQASANIHLQLTSEPHRLEFRRLGYQPEVREITPRTGFTQRMDVRLMTLEDARLARLKPEILTSSNQTLVLLKPSDIELGASRREAGRRANEAMRRVPMSREFYVSTSEVTNAQFRAFAPGHTSGSHAGHSLNEDNQPAVYVSWEEASRYCNWLSEQDGLESIYDIHGSTLEGWDLNRSGYRLPTEAEWAWAARFVAPRQPLLRMPWGDGPKPPERHGNYADTSASYVVSRVIFGYNDNAIVSAPVASFEANSHGLFDMGGNVAEWVHDFYEQSPAPQQPRDAAGPQHGEYHVIRGSSWMHGSLSDLRLSYRDYGDEGRADLGFRITKYVD